MRKRALARHSTDQASIAGSLNRANFGSVGAWCTRTRLRRARSDPELVQL